MSNDEPILVLCTAPAEGETAAELAAGLVEARLAACVNLVPGLRSFYRWQGKVHDDPEVQLFIKTRRRLYPELQRWLQDHHPYDVPEILALPIDQGAPTYLDWLTEQTEPV